MLTFRTIIRDNIQIAQNAIPQITKPAAMLPHMFLKPCVSHQCELLMWQTQPTTRPGENEA